MHESPLDMRIAACLTTSRHVFPPTLDQLVQVRILARQLPKIPAKAEISKTFTSRPSWDGRAVAVLANELAETEKNVTVPSEDSEHFFIPSYPLSGW